MYLNQKKESGRSFLSLLLSNLRDLNRLNSKSALLPIPELASAGRQLLKAR